MADMNDVQRIALALPDTSLDDDRIAFSVTNKGKRKGIAWVWMERVHPKKACAQSERPRHPSPRPGRERQAARRSPGYALHRAALQRLPGRADQACRDRRRRA